MHPARIAELLEPFLDPANGQQLTANDLSDISTYIDLLLLWNARINLTAIRDPEEIVTRHFGESLFSARHLFPDRVATDATRPELTRVRPAEGSSGKHGNSDVETPAAEQRRTSDHGEEPEALASTHFPAAERRQNSAHGASRGFAERNEQAPQGRKKLSLADLGSGAGFPGLPIKLWAPQLSLTLIESNHKKSTFLREVTRALTLTDANIQNTRAESFPPATFDVVTLRAVEHFESILPTAAALVRPGGRLALLVGSPQIPEAAIPTLTWSAPQTIPLSHSRVLLLAKKPISA